MTSRKNQNTIPDEMAIKNLTRRSEFPQIRGGKKRPIKSGTKVAPIALRKFTRTSGMRLRHLGLLVN
jgi:hypothetical protein